MATCNKCSNQDLEFKEGNAKTGKNIGKPWKAWYCKPCKNMMFINTPKSPNGNSNFSSRTSTTSSSSYAPTTADFFAINQKLDKVLELLGYKKTKTVLEQSEIMDAKEEDFEESPF